MNVKFNSDTGLMYIHFATGIPNIQMPTSNDLVSKFVSKVNKDHVIGYEIEDAASQLDFVVNKLGLNRKQKLAVVMCFIREKRKKTQKEFSSIVHVSEGTYKSIERAEHNISFDTLDVIYNEFKDEIVLQQIF